MSRQKIHTELKDNVIPAIFTDIIRAFKDERHPEIFKLDINGLFQEIEQSSDPNMFYFIFSDKKYRLTIEVLAHSNSLCLTTDVFVADLINDPPKNKYQNIQALNIVMGTEIATNHSFKEYIKPTITYPDSLRHIDVRYFGYDYVKKFWDELGKIEQEKVNKITNATSS